VVKKLKLHHCIRGGSRIFRTLVKNFVAEHRGGGVIRGGGVVVTFDGEGVANQINMCPVCEKMLREKLLFRPMSSKHPIFIEK
jgi:hypothetical protein